MAQNLPSYPSQILYRIQPGLSVPPHKSTCPSALPQAHNGDSAGKERVTAGANVMQGNAEFGICQECTCLHYLLTVECHRASAGEGEGEESMEISAVPLENH